MCSTRISAGVNGGLSTDQQICDNQESISYLETDKQYVIPGNRYAKYVIPRKNMITSNRSAKYVIPRKTSDAQTDQQYVIPDNSSAKYVIPRKTSDTKQQICNM